MNIQGYGPSISGIKTAQPMQSEQSASAQGGNFASLLKAYTEQVNHDVKTAAKSAEDLAVGKSSKSTAETLLAVQQASLSFQLMLGVRNKLVDAYHQISRMQA